LKIGKIEDRYCDYQTCCRKPFTARFKGAYAANSNHKKKTHPEKPSMRIKKIGNINAADLLASGHWHNEPDIQDLKYRNANYACVKAFSK
jgi:hypothetical protein